MAQSDDRAYLSAGKGDGAKKPASKGAEWWLGEIARSRKLWKGYRERAQKVIDRYRDEREDFDTGARVRFNILYSNVETLRPAIYSQLPNPDVRRRFLASDPVGRIGADVLNKGLTVSNERNLEPTLGACAQDYVLPGFAVARVRYAPVIEGGAIVDEDTPSEYVAWNHFAMSRSPTWERVWWVAFLEELTRDEFVAAFGEKAAVSVSFAHVSDGDEKAQDGDEHAGGKARVWEVWNKRARERFFVAEGSRGFVRAPEPDPLRLEGFFPCARPLWAIETPGNLVPVPEYLEYQDLAIELDDVTQRIHVLTGAVRRRGFYDASLQEQIANVGGMGDNQFEPVADWARLTDKGGLAAIIAEMPLEGIIRALTALYEYRGTIIQTIYEVTGMADIVRGASNPNETATAQQIKGKFAGLRLGERQRKFQLFVRDLMRIKAEIMAEHFQQETFAAMTGIDLLTDQQKQQAQAAIAQHQQMAQMAQQQGGQPPEMPPELQRMAALMAEPSWDDVVRLLRSDKLRGFRVDVETDSTIQPNADEERQQRIDLVQSIAGAVQQFVPAVQSGMISAELAKELITFSVRAFKTAPQVEQALESLGQQGPMPPQVQAAMQQIQQKEAELAKREEAAQKLEMEATQSRHDAQLAAERAQRQEVEAAAAKRMLEMVERFQSQLDAQAAKHDAELRKLAQGAEEAVEAALAAASAPTNPPITEEQMQ